MSNVIDAFDDIPWNIFGKQAAVSDRENATTADRLSTRSSCGPSGDATKIKVNIEGARNIKIEVRGQKKLATSSCVAQEPSTRGPTNLSSTNPTKDEARGSATQHADDGGGMSRREIEEIIAAQTDDVMAFVEDIFTEQRDLLERQKTEQADLLIEILRRVYACEMVLEMLDNPRYRHGRREVPLLCKALARNRRFRATA